MFNQSAVANEYQFELLGRTYDKHGSEKDPTSFEVGEEAIFKICVYEDSAISVNCKYLKYTVSYDDGQSTESAVVDASSGEITFKTKALTKPGAIRAVVSVCDENGNLMKENSANLPADLPFHFNGSVIAGFDDIRLTTVETPSEKANVDVTDKSGVLIFEEAFADRSFDEFWAEKLETIKNVDYSAAKVREINGIDSYRIYEVYIPFGLPGDEQNTANNKTALYMSIPNDAQKGTLGIKAFYQGYGIADPMKFNTPGFITLSVSSHSMLLGQEASYYSELGTGELKEYGLNRDMTQTTPDESYFVGMLLRDIVAVSFAKQYSQNGDILFDGKRLEFGGGSQGAFQSIAVASFLKDKATKITVQVPWLCDLNGINTGRHSAEFRPTWAENGCQAYFDTGLFAKRVTCDAEIKAGLGDYVCPPSGIISMYHNLASSNKSITLCQNMVHSQTVMPLSDGMNYTHKK